MIDIVGYIKVDESKPERVKMLLACIHSLSFLKGHCKFLLCLQQPSTQLFQEVKKAAYDAFGDDNLVGVSHTHQLYGYMYSEILSHCNNDYTMNFIEDHFCLIDDIGTMKSLLHAMHQYEVDVCKASFFNVEHKSCKTLNLISDNHYGKVFLNDEHNHREYMRYYKDRYFIGVNFITTREFAVKFWKRDIKSTRPHAFEVPRFSKHLIHTCMIPNLEILASIDDDHGEDGSCLLKRYVKKFWNIYNDISKPQLTETT